MNNITSRNVYQQDKALKESLIKRGVPSKEASQQAYRHQFAYSKTPLGKAAKARANKKSWENLKSDPVKYAAYLERRKVYRKAIVDRKRLTVTIFPSRSK